MLVGEILDEIMNALALKQGPLAKKIGVSQGTISKWKSGDQSPNLSQWAPVEALIWAMMDLQPAIGRTVTEDLQFKNRWRTAMKLASRDERFIEIKNGLLAQQNEMKALESDRNLIIHGVWQRDHSTITIYLFDFFNYYPLVGVVPWHDPTNPRRIAKA